MVDLIRLVNGDLIDLERARTEI